MILSTYSVGGVQMSTGSYQQCVEALAERVATGPATHVHFVNAYVIALAAEDPAYAELLNDGLCLTDGQPLAWIGRRAYAVVPGQWERVYGPDVMRSLLQVEGIRHYLLGGSEQTLKDLRAHIETHWPRAQIAGAYSPPFRALTPGEIADQDERILQSGANIIWVGLGTPKQDWETARITRATGLTALGVGAAFDFLAGSKPQAPVWMQRAGLEWAFRLASEPRRLTHRYIWGNPRFLVAAARDPGLRRD